MNYSFIVDIEKDMRRRVCVCTVSGFVVALVEMGKTYRDAKARLHRDKNGEK